MRRDRATAVLPHLLAAATVCSGDAKMAAGRAHTDMNTRAAGVGAWSATGLTLNVYNNSAWYGAPMETSIVAGFDQQLPIHPGTSAFSVELVGTLTYPQAKPCFENDKGCYTFNCSFGAATYGFLWFDDHLVCQAGAYVLHPDSFDGSAGNPLRVLSKRAVVVRLQAYFDPDAADIGVSDSRRAAVEANALELRRGVEDSSLSTCNSSWHNGDEFLGHDYHAQVTQTCAECGALCAADANCAAVVWNAPGGKYGDRNCNMKFAAPPHPWKTNQKGEMALVMRPNRQHRPPAPVPPPPPLPATLDLSVRWMSGWGSSGPISPPAFSPIDSSILTPAIAPEEETRAALQQNLTNGWGTWANSVLDLVLMPEGARITVGLCQYSTGKCISSTRPSDTDTMRVAEHAYDKSYVRMFLTFQAANVSVEFSSGTGDQASELEVALTPLNCNGAGEVADGPTVNCSDFAVTVLPSWAWGRAGKWSRSSESLTASAAGLRDVTIYSSSPSDNLLHISPELPTSSLASTLELSFPLGSAGAGLSTKGPNPTFNGIVSHLADARKIVHTKHEKYGDLKEVASAVQSAVMWCLLYVPSELGPFAPVSRSWAFLTPARVPSRTDEWVYVIFDWDNLFASYLFALDARDWAYSNLIQVVRSKTSQGFIANFASAGQKSLDRTEPMIGAKIVLELYRKFNDKWIVDLLLNDLIDWHDWFATYRILKPKGLICLGSNPVDGDTYWSPNTLNSAKLESGLDNSPMWDGSSFNNVTHQMQLYELSQSSFYVAEAAHLIELAAAVGRSEETAHLVTRQQSMKKLIAETMWDNDAQVFANRYPDDAPNGETKGIGGFSQKISPTSFYPLLANASTDAQAVAMTEHWLTNKTRFCINENYQTENDGRCYWGLPSISADDPTFPPLGYWRGYVWGPMAQLTFWSLQQYDHLPAVRSARKAMCKQMTAMFLEQWRLHAHICENFNPHKNGTEVAGKVWPDDCTGCKFYHWGALTGMISLIEEGYWE